MATDVGFRLSKAARAGGTFTFASGEKTLTIQHRALLPGIDLPMAANRAAATARRIRDGLEAAGALGFALPDGFGSGWSWDDWESFAQSLVQAELLGLVAVSWEGVADEETGEPFPISPDAIRALMLADPEIYQAWAAYAARVTVSAAEGNVSALSPTGSSAGAGATAKAAVSPAARARRAGGRRTAAAARK